MHKRGIDVYLGSRIRTMSFIMDAFCPWRSYIIIPSEGLPTFFTFIIDAARVADETWLDRDHMSAYGPLEGIDQVAAITNFINSISASRRDASAMRTVFPRTRRKEI